MPSQLLPHQIDELVRHMTQAKVGPDWTDIAQPYQEFVAVERIFNKQKKRTDNMESLEWTVRVSTGDSARYAGLFDQDQVDVKPLTRQARSTFTMISASYGYDTNELKSMGKNRIIDTIAIRLHTMWEDFFTKVEEGLWLSPSSDSLDPMELTGIPHWAQRSATTGFNGANPSGWSNGAGNISSTTYERWKNYTWTYSAVDLDFVKSLVEACDKTKYKPPRNYNKIGGHDQRLGFYTTYPVQQEYNQLLTNMNDNVGRDAARYFNEPVVKGIPMVWVPALTDSSSPAYDSTDPVYGIDWSEMKVLFHQGMDKIVTMKHAPNQRHVRNTFLDSWMQAVCYNRRRLSLGYRV